MQNQPGYGGAPEPAPTGMPPQATAQATGQGSTPAAAATPTNTYGWRAILASAASLIVSAVTAFFFERVFIYFALLGVYGIYAGIRGIITSFRMPKRQGLITSIIGLLLSVAAILFTLWLLTPA